MAAISNVDHGSLFITPNSSLGLDLENNILNGNFEWMLRKQSVII